MINKTKPNSFRKHLCCKQAKILGFNFQDSLLLFLPLIHFSFIVTLLQLADSSIIWFRKRMFYRPPWDPSKLFICMVELIIYFLLLFKICFISVPSVRYFVCSYQILKNPLNSVDTHVTTGKWNRKNQHHKQRNAHVFPISKWKAYEIIISQILQHRTSLLSSSFTTENYFKAYF